MPYFPFWQNGLQTGRNDIQWNNEPLQPEWPKQGTGQPIHYGRLLKFTKISEFDNRYLLGLATTLCNLVLVAIYPFLPESPRWLLAQVPKHPLLPRQGRHAEAAAIITNMRRINKDEELPNLEERLRELMPVRETASTERATLTAFVRRASLFRVGLSLSTIWCVNDYFYIAGSMNVENLAGDMFVNFSLLSLTELPSVFIGQFLIDRFGRRWVHLCCMAITTLAFAVICLLAGDKSLGLAVIVLSILSKFASNVGWFIMWVQCVEVFPTPLRGTGMNLCVMISTVVSMTGPFVVDLVGVQNIILKFIHLFHFRAPPIYAIPSSSSQGWE